MEFKEFDVIEFAGASKDRKQEMLEELPVLDLESLNKLSSGEDKLKTKEDFKENGKE